MRHVPKLPAGKPFLPLALDRVERGQVPGAGNNGPVSTATASSFLNAAGAMGGCRSASGSRRPGRERRVLTRVSRAGWRLEQAERERTWALVPARAEGISIRTLAAAVGLSPSWVHQLVAGADLDALDAALGELRAGQHRKIPIPGRTPNPAAGTASPAGYRMR